MKSSYYERKFDREKPRWDLLNFSLVRSIVTVLTYGARKYGPNTWQKVPNGEARYLAALMRHLDAYQSGERLDPESGISHLWHAFCNLYFMVWFERRRWAKHPKKGEQ